MASFNKFDAFVANLAEAVCDLNTDALYIMLSNTLPVATNSIYTDITEIAAGNGYTAGGNAAAFSSGAQTSGVYKLILSSPATWTASGGSVGPFEYAILYDSTPTSPAKPLIGWWDYGSALTLASGDTFTVSLDATNGVLQIS